MADQDQSLESQYSPQQTEAMSCAKTEVETGIDWISALPDSLIVEILCKIPITDACTTTVLSKRWQNLWTCIHSLNCDRWKTGRSDNRFISFMDNALPLLTFSKIKSFTLHFRPKLALSNYSPKLDKWLQIALKKGVEDLDLDVSHSYELLGFYLDTDRYSLPQYLCSSSSVLKLNCMYIRIPEDCILNWTSLKSLTLTFILLTEEHMEQITSNCHHLESLKLSDFCGFHRLRLTSPKCTRLELMDHSHPPDYMGGDCYFEIVAPYVQHLKISGHFNPVEIRLGDLSSLIHADLTYNSYDNRGVGDVIEKTIVKDHLTSVACANELIISSLYIEDCTFLNYWCEYIDVLEDKYKNIFVGSLQNLKTLKVILQWSLFTVDMPEQTELMKYLVEHAKNLEKLVIVAAKTGCSKRIKSLLALRRVSNTTVVVSLE